MVERRQRYKFLFVFSFWCVLFLGVLGIALLLFAPKEQRISERENRYLAGFPVLTIDTLADGSFMTGFESYLSDGFFLRDSFVDASKKVLRSFSLLTTEEYLDKGVDLEDELKAFMEEMEAEGEAIPADEPEATDEPETETEEIADPADPAATAVIPDEPAQAAPTTAPVALDTTGMQEKYTFWRTTADGTVKQVYTFPLENIVSVAGTLNDYRAALPEDGRLHFIQVPYPQIARSLQPGTACGWGSDMEQALESLCSDGVVIHSGTGILEQALLDGEYVYFRTDHHWASYGAYLAACDVARADGVPPVDYRDFAYTIKYGFVGSFANDDPSVDLSGQADMLELLHPAAPTTGFILDDPRHPENGEEIDLIGYERRSYTAFLYGTRGPWRRIFTGFETGRNALIITDSYGNVFTPYLLPYYTEVHVTDLRPRYFSKETAGASIAEYIALYGITDVIVLLSTASSVNAEYMLSYMPAYLH